MQHRKLNFKSLQSRQKLSTILTIASFLDFNVVVQLINFYGLIFIGNFSGSEPKILRSVCATP